MTSKLLRERAFFFGMVSLLIIIVCIMLWPFVTTILLALAVVVIIHPLYRWFLKSRLVRGRETWATVLTIITFILAIAGPIIAIASVAVTQAASLFSGLDFESIDFTLSGTLAPLESLLAAETGILIDETQITAALQEWGTTVATWFGNLVITLGKSIPQFFTNALILLVIMFVLLPRYRRPDKDEFVELIPFPNAITQLFLDKIELMIVAMFRGVFIIGIVQGAAMGLVLLIAGVPYTIFLTLLSMVLSLLPVVGISLVAWPVGIILILTGQVWQGVFVIAAFLLVVANIDTILRPRLVPKGAYLNPALVILSVFGGLYLMGIVGALYGPVIMILLVTSLEVYGKYFLRTDLETILGEDRDVDLEELGLAIEKDDDEATKSPSVLAVVNNLVGYLRGGSQ
jgi:predicted PurR-regulated permease PerM